MSIPNQQLVRLNQTKTINDRGDCDTLNLTHLLLCFVHSKMYKYVCALNEGTVQKYLVSHLLTPFGVLGSARGDFGVLVFKYGKNVLPISTPKTR